MKITATEFKENFGKYLTLAQNENIIITKNGKPIAEITKPRINNLKLLESLIGIAKVDKEIDLDKLKMERILSRWKY